MGSRFEDAVIAIRQALSGFDRVEVLLREAADRIDTARVILTEAASGTGSAKVQASIDRLGTVLEALEAAYTPLAGGLDEFGEYLEEIGADGVMTVGPQPSVPPTRPARDTSAFTPLRRNREREAMMVRIGWPKKQSAREGEGEIAGRGLLFCEDGTQWGSEDEPVSAGPTGPASLRTDLKPEWQAQGMTTTFHVEGHAAAYMVEHGHQRAVLYVNQAVCGSEMPFDLRRCRENTQHVLPEGNTLWVHSVQESGMVRITRHAGTGKAIKDDR